MTRTQIETDIWKMLSMVDTDGTITAPTQLRTYLQNIIQSAHDDILTEGRYSFRRKKFAALLKTPVTTGTISITKLSTTATLSTSIADQTWIGGHIEVSGNGFPLRVAAASGTSITFTEPVIATTNSAASYTMYFDGVLVPTDCVGIELDTVKLAGHRFLTFFNVRELDSEQGYFGLDGSDYGFWNGIGLTVLSTPLISQPTVWTTWGFVQDTSNITRQLINVYPFPDQDYALSWEGWKKPSTLSGDASVSEIPEEYHQTVLLPLAKLKLTEFPGFELTSSEKQTLNAMYERNLAKMKADYSDVHDSEPYYPHAVCR